MKSCIKKCAVIGSIAVLVITLVEIFKHVTDRQLHTVDFSGDLDEEPMFEDDFETADTEASQHYINLKDK